MAKQYLRLARLVCLNVRALKAHHEALLEKDKHTVRFKENLNLIVLNRNKHAPWWELAQERENGYFKKETLARSMYPFDAHRSVEFVIIKHPIGYHKRFYKVEVEHDHKLTRYFVTNSGARSYFEHLVGISDNPHTNMARWGWKSVKELKAFLEEATV